LYSECAILANECPLLSTLISGSFFEHSCSTAPIWAGTVCQPKCDPGFDLVSDVKKYRCVQNGIWSPRPSDVICHGKYF